MCAARAFEVKPAVREAVGLLLGIVGPSSTGKTFSALRLATGIQRVVGGEIDVIDTENGRALYYADKFKFNHLRFAAPFSPLDYLGAIEHCVKKRGAKIVIVDSMSHEHEGPGGVLEMHEQEVQRLSGGDSAKAERVKMLAWSKPKQARRKMINEILQLNANVLFTFRAKEKVKVIPGKPPESRGYQPIAGEEFIYEMVMKCLLLPGANGVPSWASEYADERAMMKLPEQFKEIFAEQKQLDEEIGVKLAQWASGTPPLPTVSEYDACNDAATLDRLEARRSANWRATPAAAKAALKAASDEASKRVAKVLGGKVDKSTGELTLDGNPPDPEVDAIAKLEAAYKSGDKALSAAMAEIAEGYIARDVEIPMSVDAKFIELRDALAAKE